MRRIGFVVSTVAAALLLVVTPAGAGLQPAGWQIARADPQAGEQDALSCVTPSWCMSVGYGGNLTWDGEQWQHAPGDFRFRVADLSCPSRWDCTAVGTDTVEGAVNAQSVDVPVAMHWNGTSWDTMRLPVQLPDEHSLSGVACPAARSCWLVGSLVNRALLWQNGAWSSFPVPLPAGATRVFLGDVDCAAASSCHALATVRFASGPDRPGVAAWDGAAWSVELLAPDPQGGPQLSSISCPTTSSCVAVGANGNVDLVAEVWDGVTWRETAVPESPHRGDNAEQTINGYENLTGVSCWAANRCQAVGVTNTAPIHRVWNGSTWSVLANPAATDDLAATGEAEYDVNQVDCYYASFCLTAGGVLFGTLVGDVYMERYAT